MKVAQGVYCPVANGEWVNLNEVNTIKEKDRKANGFGSTGI
jgi:dUTPase